MIITTICYFRLISISLLLSLSLSSSLSILPVLQATSQVFALVPVGSQEYGRQRGHLMNVLPPVDTYSFTCHGQVFYLQYKSQPEEWV